MKTFLPNAFRPNRVERSSAPDVKPFQANGTFVSLFQEAARINLSALLQAVSPVAMPAVAFDAAFGKSGETDPLAGFGLVDWHEGKLPDSAFARRLMAEPMRAAAIATPHPASERKPFCRSFCVQRWARVRFGMSWQKPPAVT